MRMVNVSVEPPITKDDGMELKGIYFSLYFEIKYRKAILQRGYKTQA